MWEDHIGSLPEPGQGYATPEKVNKPTELDLLWNRFDRESNYGDFLQNCGPHEVDPQIKREPPSTPVKKTNSKENQDINPPGGQTHDSLVAQYPCWGSLGYLGLNFRGDRQTKYFRRHACNILQHPLSLYGKYGTSKCLQYLMVRPVSGCLQGCDLFARAGAPMLEAEVPDVAAAVGKTLADEEYYKRLIASCRWKWNSW